MIIQRNAEGEAEAEAETEADDETGTLLLLLLLLAKTTGKALFSPIGTGVTDGVVEALALTLALDDKEGVCIIASSNQLPSRLA